VDVFVLLVVSIHSKSVLLQVNVEVANIAMCKTQKNRTSIIYGLKSINIPHYRGTKTCKPTCNLDTQCSNNEICISGVCKEGCNWSEQCPEDYKCFQNSCFKKCRRSTDFKCPSTLYCDLTSDVSITYITIFIESFKLRHLDTP
jgi:hypothetical protein